MCGRRDYDHDTPPVPSFSNHRNIEVKYREFAASCHLSIRRELIMGVLSVVESFSWEVKALLLGGFFFQAAILGTWIMMMRKEISSQVASKEKQH
jgi:hypothetical protein